MDNPPESSGAGNDKGLEEVVNTNGIYCSNCGCHCTQRKSLYRHVRKFHPSCADDIIKQYNVICSLCDRTYKSLTELHSHIQADHLDVKLSFQKFFFYCMDDFIEWKHKYEQETNSFFVKRRGDRQLSDGRIAMHYFCHRSGIYKPKADGKCRLKVTGSIKFGKSCPAHIEAYKQTVDEAIEIEVLHQSVHIGHEKEIRRKSLSGKRKKQLAGKMSLGVPKSKVLTNILKEFSPTKHISFTHEKDLRNICHDFKIEEEVVFHQNDAMSVDIRVKKMQNENDNPVLIYKPVEEFLPGYPLISKEEFMLSIMNDAQLKLLELYGDNGVMIDSTYGTNQYGFQLTTLMVNDSNHESLPVAILYSTRISAKIFIPFFMAIKNRVPNLKPKFFMSVDAPALYNGFKAVFGEVDQYLICSWHVNRAWNVNLNYKVKDKHLQQIVKKKLQQMLQEPDLTTFNQISKAYVDSFLLCEESKAFGEYFNSYYMNRVEQWAYCYRIHSGINTNMKLERWHRELKYEEAGGKVIKTLDKSLCLVLNAIARKLVGHIVSMEQKKNYITEIVKRHDSSKQLTKDSVFEMKPKLLWIVNSSNTQTSTTFLETYTVLYQKECFCDIRCDDCNVCIHQFTCTCFDYCIRFIMCKHIHLVCQHFTFGSSPDLSSDIDSSNIADGLVIETAEQNKQCPLEHAAITKELKKTVITTISDQERASVISELQNLVAKCQSSESTIEELKVMQEGISVVNVRLAAVQANARVMTSVSKTVNKNVKPKRRMHPLKKLKLESSSHASASEVLIGLLTGF